MNCDEMLKCLIERDEYIQAKPEGCEEIGNSIYDSWEKILLGRSWDLRNKYFVVIDMSGTYQFPIILTPEQMKAYICYENPKWSKEIEKMIRENPDTPLHEIIYTWCEEHKGITAKLMSALIKPDNRTKYLSKKDIQDNPFDIYAPQDIFNGESWYGMITNHFVDLLARSITLYNHLYPFKTFYNLYDRWVEERGSDKLLSRFDQFVLMFREELGVRSLKEIESLESAICYLLYQSVWIVKHCSAIEERMWEDFYDERLEYEYISKHPNHSAFEFFSSRNGFDGELWASYDEFMHDEWLDDSFAKQLEDEDIRIIYEKVRTLALKKLS